MTSLGRSSSCYANQLISGRKHEQAAPWTQVAGAPHPETTPINEATPFAADLFAVTARNAREAIAGGAVCTDEDVAREQVEGCERVPVIYATDEDNPWREVYRADGPGYVGAIAWIRRGEAIAVGGTGTYPRREPNPPGEEWDYEARVNYDKEHGAGDARAWHLHDGAWEEISDELPDEMRGLSALDVWVGREDDGDEWGIAGAYGQLWEWEGGRFTGQHIDRDSPGIGAEDPEWGVVDGPLAWTKQCDLQDQNNCTWQPSTQNTERSSPGFFHYRVREIRIAPDRSQRRAIAFTAGCCGPASAGGSRRIEFREQPRKDGAGVSPDEAPARDARPRWIVSDADPDTPGDNYGESVYSFAFKQSRFFNGFNTPDEFGEPQPDNGTLVWNAGQRVISTAAPIGPDPLVPETAVTAQPRYVASDGDTEPDSSFNPPVTGNGIPDWKAGEGPSSDPKFRGLGVLATTNAASIPEYGGLRPYCTSSSSFGDGFGGIYWDPTGAYVKVCELDQVQTGEGPSLDQDGPIRGPESGIQLGPSWALNGIDMLDRENVGYAVGDHGAILRFGSAPAESDPPSLGSRRPAALADVTPYDGKQPGPAGVTAEVPPLAAQPRERLDEPRMVRAGSPDGNEIGTDLPAEDVDTIVMSRDGSEGWAFGPSPDAQGGFLASTPAGVMTLHHYEGGRWTRCDPLGDPGVREPDAACAALSELYTAKSGEFVPTRIRLEAAARIPLEYDSDPSNDDEFEVLAVGNTLEKVPDGCCSTRGIPTIVRYRDGRWELEPFEVRSSLNPSGGWRYTSHFAPHSLACLGPDECWLAGVVTSGRLAVLARYDGHGWTDCSRGNAFNLNTPLVNQAACGDFDNRLPRLSVKTAFSRPLMTVSSAGERMYLAGIRVLGRDGSGAIDQGTGAPAILYKDHGSSEKWSAEGGGYDPGFEDAAAAAGAAASVAVAQRADGSYEGWATGAFQVPATVPILSQSRVLAKAPLLQLDPATGEWRPYTTPDAARDYLGNKLTSGFEGTLPERQVTLPGEGSEPGRAYIATRYAESEPSHLLAFNPDRERWELAEKPGTGRLISWQRARFIAVAPDNHGGVWAAAGTDNEPNLRMGRSDTYYYNYTETPPREVFAEADHPMAERERPTDLAGAPDGSIWITTDQGALYRRDRVTGWERVEVPGWDPGRLVTRRSPAYGVAFGPDGSGLAVGEAGRVATLSPAEARLDLAAGTVCAAGGAEGPCGTSFDLRSAAIAQDGSGAALVGGEKLALLWRPGGPGGQIRKIASPDAPPAATIAGIAMPSADRAWLALTSGQVFAGTGDGSGGWRWRQENLVEVNDLERLPNEDRRGEPLALRDVAVDVSGHGFAVGDRGVVLERKGDGPEPWRVVDSGVTERLTEVELPTGAGSGGLIGGERGLILTLAGGQWRPSRAGDQFRPDNGQVTGLALLPGYDDAQAEAWALVSPAPGDFRTGNSQLLHYGSDPTESLLDTTVHGAQPLADAPRPREGEIPFAALGRTDCHFINETDLYPCPPLENGTETESTFLRRVRQELIARSARPGAPEFSIFTGDAYESAGNAAVEPIEQNSRLAGQAAVYGHDSAAALNVSWTGGEKLRRFNEQLGDYLPDHGLPIFAPIGSRDLSEVRQCVNGLVALRCASNQDTPRIGDNLTWRQAMESKPAPWGAGEPVSGSTLSFEPLPDSEGATRVRDASVDVPPDEPIVVDPLPGEDITVDPPPDVLPGLIPGVSVTPKASVPPPDDVQIPAGGASTHYAADLLRGERRVGRLIVVDTSLGSLAASDPVQQPVERDGQLAWLERVLCIEGSTTDTGQCTRGPGQQAIVVSTTPTYSYGPTSPTETEIDGALLESVLLRNHANVVVSGRLGWNGRYWALAPGLHEPCPGDPYVPDHQAPQAGAPRACGNEAVATDPSGAVNQAGEALGALGGTGALPFVVASNAGGRFNEFGESAGQTTADKGFWRGYTVVRLDPSGDPAKTVVEQRPILDWIGLTAKQHVLRANKKLALNGRGREPIAAAIGQIGSGRFDELTTAAVTHRYELLEADPDRPWLPREDQGAADDTTEVRSPASQRLGEQDPCGPYLCLPSSVATVDDQSGQVKAGRGDYPRTYAVAQLSVGEQSATYPLVFEPRSSFQAPAPPPPAPVAVPAPPPPPAAAPPTTPQVNLPSAPVLPVLTAQALAPPPVPPSPPTFASQAPLDLNLSPAALDATPPTAVSQPPTPPVNPAPPSGARREARQRQAAAQKSGADSGEESAGDEQTGDLAKAPDSHDAAMTRRDGSRIDHSFTAVRHDEPSASARGLLYGGGLTIAALALAFGFSTLRPTPRRRSPELPAPAFSRAHGRGHRR